MWFFLSKTVGGWLSDPAAWSLLLLGSALFLRLYKRGLRVMRSATWGAVAILLFFSSDAVGMWLMRCLETQYSQPRASQQNNTAPAAIVMLTGLTSARDEGYELNEAADRFVETVRLAHLYPNALLVLSGGSSQIRQGDYREAERLAELAVELGVSKKRLRVDRNARNTYENAVESKRLLTDIRGPIYLVTSASHMPRAMACFARQGMTVTAWPVDYQSRGFFWTDLFPSPTGLILSQRALHEYLGWLHYKVLGYI